MKRKKKLIGGSIFISLFLRLHIICCILRQYSEHQINPRLNQAALHWYIYSCDFEAAKTLVAHGADPMIKTEEGETSLEIVRKLVEKQPSEARECVKILDMFEKVIMEGQTRSDAL